MRNALFLALFAVLGAGTPAAAATLRAIDAGRPAAYVPSIWRVVMLAVKCLPRWVRRRVDF